MKKIINCQRLWAMLWEGEGMSEWDMYVTLHQSDWGSFRYSCTGFFPTLQMLHSLWFCGWFARVQNSSQVFAFRIIWNFEWTTWWFKWIKIVQGQERLFLFWQNALFIWRGGFSPRSYSPTEAHLCSVITGPIVICTSELNYEKVILICFALQEWHEAVSSRDRSKSTGGGGGRRWAGAFQNVAFRKHMTHPFN